MSFLPRSIQRAFVLAIVASAALPAFGSAKAIGQASATGSLPKRTHIRQVVTRQEVKLDPSHRLWIYRPKKAKGKLPLILIAPAGSPLFVGMDLGEGSSPEHVPYAQAGCVVVAFDVSGNLPEAALDMAPAIKAFMAADAGIVDGRRALDYALKFIPEVDPLRVIAVGHSSAGTIALQMAESDSRIRACIAYAPAVDVPTLLKSATSKIEPVIPGFSKFLSRTSPSSHEDRLRQPLFLFHAYDDDVVPIEPIRQLARAVPKATLLEVRSGGHYNSMITKGIPAAIEWLRKQKLLGR